MARTAQNTARSAKVSAKAAPKAKALGPVIQVNIAGGAVKLAAALGLRKEPTLDGKTPLVKRAAFTLLADETGLTFKARASNLPRITKFLRNRATAPAIFSRAKIVADDGVFSEAILRRAHVTESRRGLTVEAE